jgi:hypothetical protein
MKMINYQVFSLAGWLREVIRDFPSTMRAAAGGGEEKSHLKSFQHFFFLSSFQLNLFFSRIAHR